MDNQTLINNFNLICNAVKNLRYQTSRSEDSKLNMNCYISVHRPACVKNIYQWIECMTIHLIDDKNIEFQAGKNHTVKHTFEIINKSVIPIDSDTLFTFYTDFTKFVSHIVCIQDPDRYNDSERYYDPEPYIYREFFNNEINITQLASKDEHFINKGTILGVNAMYAKNCVKINKISKDITVFKDCNSNIQLLMFNNIGKYEIECELQDPITLDKSYKTYIVNVE